MTKSKNASVSQNTLKVTAVVVGSEDGRDGVEFIFQPTKEMIESCKAYRELLTGSWAKFRLGLGYTRAYMIPASRKHFFTAKAWENRMMTQNAKDVAEGIQQRLAELLLAIEPKAGTTYTITKDGLVTQTNNPVKTPF